ncbi:Ig-like domain-containing protein [Dysgonomonas gadei]|uniref:F5/8 type C domain-containing protein n=1 Tax=Dysgonomonas gadei ATCC BAA-286 TaxID=742766 RepID=F5J2A2_9BACT|nr:Ig-like domain-containing protein [Dysgonomonas gadei]EGK00222.1 hypothetical protein HMPREF9455_03361 [Dysgonomonas gadei ATCC BAA-286]
MKKKFFLNAIFLSLFLFGCSDKENEDEDIGVSSITIENVDSNNAISVKKGTTLQLEVTTNPPVNDAALVYESGYTDVFSVDHNGVVTALKEGEATLTIKSAKDFSVFITATVVVPNVPIESIQINNLANDTIELEANTKYQLKVDVLPENATVKTLNYQSGNSTIFSVSDNGLILGLAKGCATLTVSTTDGSSISQNYIVKVKRAKVNYIGGTDMIVLKGSQVDISAGLSFTPSTASLEGVVFSSSDTNVATIDTNGIVTGISPGEVTITIKATDGSDVSGTCKIAVGDGFTPIDRTNFTVACSSEKESDGGGKNMILNDDYAKYWHSEWGPDAGLPHWLLITMDDNKTISKIKIGRRNSGSVNTDTKVVEIEGSLDGIKYTALGTINFGDNNNHVQDMSIEFYPQVFKYIKLTITESNRPPFANLALFQPYVLE